MSKLDQIRDDDGNVPTYAWPGGYAIAYVADDGEFLCAKCVNTEEEVHEGGDADGWRVDGYVTADWHDDGDAWICAHCGAVIDPGYDDEETAAAVRDARNLFTDPCPDGPNGY